MKNPSTYRVVKTKNGFFKIQKKEKYFFMSLWNDVNYVPSQVLFSNKEEAMNIAKTLSEKQKKIDDETLSEIVEEL